MFLNANNLIAKGVEMLIVSTRIVLDVYGYQGRKRIIPRLPTVTFPKSRAIHESEAAFVIWVSNRPVPSFASVKACDNTYIIFTTVLHVTLVCNNSSLMKLTEPPRPRGVGRLHSGSGKRNVTV